MFLNRDYGDSALGITGLRDYGDSALNGDYGITVTVRLIDNLSGR